ncbi:hypothetical protein, partial [Asticcacaulis sp.]|uniref:hypothetical protein n=1 Tax=Asticcacaulis sp. TaxID=1872648 RepID=UPI003F7B5354
LADTVNAALARSGFDDQRQAFRRHVAALLKDHLYAYDPIDTLAILTHQDMVKEMKMMVSTIGAKS